MTKKNQHKLVGRCVLPRRYKVLVACAGLLGGSQYIAARSLVFCVVYCRSFSFCPFSFWSRLSLFKLRLLITQTAIIIIYAFIHRYCVINVGMGSVSVLFLTLLSSRVSHLMEVNMSYVGI